MKNEVYKNEIENILKNADLKAYRSVPFWSWNDKLDKAELVEQIKWMKEQGMGGYFMHARTGLVTEYLSDEWFECVGACIDAGEKLGMDSWVYDENGWPSGFVGGKLLEDPENCDKYLTCTVGDYDSLAKVSYKLEDNKLVRVSKIDKEFSGEYLNIFETRSISTADVLNPKVVDKFIELTHEEYKKRLGDKFKKSFKGFFTDEPQYFRAKQPFTDMITKLFLDEYDEDIYDKLGLLFVEKDGYREFRYRFWKGMQKLLVENYAKRVYKWCKNNGCEFTGHYIEERHLEFQMQCCAGVMPLYEYETIPGIDHLGKNLLTPVGPKQVSSVARQLGKKQVLTESFACCGWDTTPTQLKRVLEWQYVNGVNLLCQHLVPYTERNQGKRDHPAHFSKVNPWVREDFKTFNDYFAKLGYLLGESLEKVNVGLFCPIRSVYFDYKREKFGSGNECDTSYCSLTEKLSAMNIPYHILDETIMSKYAKVESGKLKVGEVSYDYIIFPKTLTMDKSTAELFNSYYKLGGKMLFTEGVPNYLEGQPHAYDFTTNTTFDEIINAQEYHISDINTKIQSTLREIDGKKYIYAVNLSDDTSYNVSFTGDFRGFVSLDLETGKTKNISNQIRFEPYQSYILFFSNEQVDYVEEPKTINLSGEFEVVSNSGNYLTLDTLEYSFDGINYSEPLRYMGVMQELLNKRHEGAVYLRYSFNVKSLPKSLYFLAEDMNNEWCEINGNRIILNESSDFEKQIYKADISNLIKIGINTAVIKINFFESDEVYFVLFGENVTEGLKNKLVYQTTIESCYLQGDFGVYAESGFIQGKKENVVRANNFYIDKPMKFVSEITSSGYPFFAGNITLRKTINYNGGNCVLNLNGRYCLSLLKVDGIEVKKSYFANKVDVTNYLKVGDNNIEITLWSGNRNLLGPHHDLDEEPRGVGPYTFEVKGSWNNGKSSEQLVDYAFVKFGLYN